MVIVTGGAGFIGSNIVRGLNEKGIDDIYIVDNLTNGNKHRNLNRIKFKDYIDKNEFDPQSFLRSNNVKAVFHQGACSDTMQADGKYMMKNNYDYSKNLLNACLAGDTRFFYASSASVYGNGDKGFSEKDICEYPLNVYAYSKFFFDKYVNGIIGNVKNQIVGLRYYNVYGPQENHKDKMASVAFHMFNQIKKGEPMKLFEGSENFKRDFIYIDDVVSVNMFLYDNPKVSGIFNCGSGRAESFCKIAETLKDVYKDAVIQTVPFPDSLKGKYQTFTKADMKKLRAAGYDKHFISLRQGVKKYAKVLEASGGYLL